MQGCQIAYFQTQNTDLGKFWRCLAMGDVATLFGHLVYFTGIGYILWPFGLFYSYWVYLVAIWYISWLFGIFFPFWYIVPRKIWQPCSHAGMS
jgi:hypothetical protein